MVNKLFLEDLLNNDDLSYTETEETVQEKNNNEPKADSGVASVLKSAERMIRVSNNPDVLQSILDVLDLNTGISDNPTQIEQLNSLKKVITKKLGNGSSLRQEINENAAIATTASTNVGVIPTPLGTSKSKKKPIRRKMPSLDVVSFMNCVKESAPALVNTAGKELKNNVLYGKSILTIDGKVYPYLSKEKICEAVDDIHRRFETVETLPRYITPLDFYLSECEKIEEATVAPIPPKSTGNKPVSDPTKEAELKQQVGQNKIATIDNTEQANNDVKINQELIGVDESDPTDKKYVLKDPQTGKILIKRSNELEIQNEAFQHYRKK